MFLRTQLSTLAAVSLLAVSGCGGGRDTHPVTGKVALVDGTPVVGARVVFDNFEKGLSAAGYTNEAGQYRLTTDEDNDGATPGQHRVIVMPPPATVVTGEGENAVVTKAPGKPIVPRKYQRYESSGLTYEVKPGQENTYDIVIQKS
jgi:hypothetical protein